MESVVGAGAWGRVCFVTMSPAHGAGAESPEGWQQWGLGLGKQLRACLWTFLNV